MAEWAPANLFIADLDGLNTYANRRLYEYTGAPPGALLGLGWMTYMHADDTVRVEAAWAQALASAGAYEMEYRLRGVNGLYRWFLVRGNRFDGADGHTHGWCGAAIDIHDARRASDTLRTSNASKDSFLATLAHELRNPLAPIRNAAHVLHTPHVSADAVQECSGVITRQVAVMARLLDDLLDVSRLTQGKLHLQLEPVQLWEVLGLAVETSRPLIDACGHELIVRLPSAPLRMSADPVRLAEVVSNLLNNAAKFTPSGGRIELSADVDADGVFVRVADNGVGLQFGSLERIFGMFTQSGEGTSPGESGLGVGLALARAIVELHGGHIEARSAGLGQGSELVMRLPTSTPQPRAAAQTQPQPGRGVRRVLLVDDNADIVESLAMLLGLEGHDVRCAGSGLQALAIARDFQPEVVVLDIGMPQMDGYELARRLRLVCGLEAARLIAVTGWGTLADKGKSSTAGFDLHFTKPVDPDQLIKAIASKLH